MVLLIVSLWFILLVSVPIVLLVSTYVGYRASKDPFSNIVIMTLGIALHIIAMALSIFPAFVIVYANAHTKPAGQAVDTTPMLFAFGIEILYGLVALSIGSILYGRERPWPLRVKGFD